jgi:hypothetical protein
MVIGQPSLFWSVYRAGGSHPTADSKLTMYPYFSLVLFQYLQINTFQIIVFAGDTKSFSRFIRDKSVNLTCARCKGVRRGLSKRVEIECRKPALRVGHPWNGRKAVLGVARPQGIEGSGKVGPGETLGSSLLPLTIRPWLGVQVLRLKSNLAYQSWCFFFICESAAKMFCTSWSDYKLSVDAMIRQTLYG